MTYFFVLGIGLLAGLFSGILGTGSSLILMPVLVFKFGPQKAVPIMALAAIFGNFGKVITWWKEINWRALTAYSISAVPASILGVHTLLTSNSHAIECLLGVFFIMMIPVRSWFRKQSIILKLWQLFLIGAVVGFLTGIVVSTGPITIPIFVGYGLVKGAFLGTEALSSLLVYITKIGAFQQYGALENETIFLGFIVGLSLMCGTIFAKRIVQKISVSTYTFLIDGLMLISGISLLVMALG